MNIEKFLSLLKEDIDIKKLNELIKGDVPAETIETLSKRMKKGKYDNKAEAVLKAAQEWKSEHGDYIRKNAGKVYAILKLMARGNSEFKPDKVLLDFHNYEQGEDKFDNFWKEKYREAQSGAFKSGKKEVLGIKNAKSKELPDAYLIFPRSFKKSGEFGINVDDTDKQYADIKQLASDLAKRDTSGEEKDGLKATDIHWCVAAPGSNGYHYKHYKDRDGGIFIVIVDKNKDGSPNFNRRYLYWIGDDGEDEFADKFDDHVDMEDVLDISTLRWLEKFRKEFVNNRKEKINDEKIKDKIRERVHSDNEKYRKSMRPTGNLKKIFNLFTERLKEAPNKGVLKQALPVIQKKNDELAAQNDLVKWFKAHNAQEHENRYSKWWMIESLPLALGLSIDDIGSVCLTYYYYFNSVIALTPQLFGENMVDLKRKLLEAKNKGVMNVYDKTLWGKYSTNSEKLKDAKEGWKYGTKIPAKSKIYKETSDAFKSNKKFLDAYNRFADDYTDHRISVSLDDNFEMYSVSKDGEKKLAIKYYAPNKSRYGGGELLGYVNDPDILEKIQAKLKEVDEYDEKRLLVNGGHKDGELVRPKKETTNYEDLPF